MPCEFLDTNVLIYAFTDDPRAVRAQQLLGQECITGVQVLNEFADVARRKIGMTWEETSDALVAVRTLCPTIVPLSLETHVDAVALAPRYNFRIFDALIVAAALRAGCETLWSEDMHDGLVVDGRLRVVNPFNA
jgi:predicted nucleic acid-binding protein